MDISLKAKRTTLDMYPKESVSYYKDNCTSVITAALFTIARKQDGHRWANGIIHRKVGAAMKLCQGISGPESQTPNVLFHMPSPDLHD